MLLIVLFLCLVIFLILRLYIKPILVEFLVFLNLFVMTTKEFIRRSDYFSLLNDCPYLNNQLYCCCYRVQLVRRIYKSVSTYYVDYPTLSCFGDSELNDCESIYFDFYSYSQFLIDMRYFKAFLSRLSKYQLESLKASGKCSHLLAFEQLNNNFNV